MSVSTSFRFGRACLTVVALWAGVAPDAVDAAPNVVLVMTDDQGYGELSCHGNPVVRTPHLDALHEQSVRLTDFHVAPMCTPTRGELMSGLDCFRNRAMNVSSGRTLLRHDVPTMADVFAAGGYATGMFGKWHLGDNFPYRPQDRGFEESIWFPSSHISSTPDYWNNDYFDDVYIHNSERTTYDGYCTDVFFSEAIRWIGEQSRAERPFFVYLPLNAPHGPLFVPDRYRDPVKERLTAALPTLPQLDEGTQAGLVSYLAMIENIDENMGRLDDALRDAGVADDTLLIFLTDNGSTMGPRYFNAGMRGGKTTIWDGGHRVPCFLRWPRGGLRQGTDIDALTHVQDLLPTLIDLCGLKKLDGPSFDGVSLARLLKGTAQELDDRMLVVQFSRMPLKNREPSPDAASLPSLNGAAVLWNKWRLLDQRELYDMAADPAQERNVLAEHPEVAERMRRHLEQWWTDVAGDAHTIERVVIGSAAENPTQLSACEWLDVFIDQQRQVRTADLKNGIWHLRVDQPGEYEFTLRRWPEESNLALRAAAPAEEVTDGRYTPGKALPISSARICAGAFEDEADVAPTDDFVTFRTQLAAGPIELRTWFRDARGEELCGAYYVTVHRRE